MSKLFFFKSSLSFDTQSSFWYATQILVKSNMWIINNEISIQDLLECSEGKHTERWAAVATPVGSSYS